MNWGKGIFIGMSLFIVFITFLVVMLISKKVDLQSEDYYDKEIKYELEINALTNANKLEEKIKIEKKEEHLVIRIPDKGKYENTSVTFIRPDNKKLDKFFLITNTKSFLIPFKSLNNGAYDVEIRFTHEGKECLQKGEIYI